MTKTEITLALDRYDRHMPFFDGTATLKTGVPLRVLQVGQSDVLRDGCERHGRMIHQREFDVAEFSMSSYLMAKDRGLPLTAIPVFPRRLFSQSCMFMRVDSEITEPRHLLGKKVALSSFQTTLSLLAKGDLKFEYNVPWEQIHWFVTTEEKVAFEPKAGVRIDKLPPDADLGELLETGQIDAFFMPHPPRSVMSGERKARRLFSDTPAEELRYFQKHGAFPIMHLLVMHEDLAAQEPWLAEAMMEAYRNSLAISADYFSDPNWSRLAWGRHYFERERDILKNAWPVGFAANRANLERFIMYSHDQGLISSRYDPERLFVRSTLAT